MTSRMETINVFKTNALLHTPKVMLDKLQDAANILREYGNMDIQDCIERIWHELGF